MINFTAGMTSTGPITPSTGESESIASPSQLQFQDMSFGMKQGEGMPGNQSQTLNHHSQSLQSPSHAMSSRPLTYEMSMIDPALMASLGSPPNMYTDSIYGGIQTRPEPQYTQSYERYHSSTPSTPTTFQDSTVTRHQRGRTLEDVNTATAPPTINRTNSVLSTLSNAETLPSTQLFAKNVKNDDNSQQDTVGFERPFKRARYPAGHDNSPSFDATMPPPNITSYPAYSVDSQASTNMLFDSSSAGTPVTPTSSHGDDALKDGHKPHATNFSSLVQTTSDVRRLSVNSLLSGPPGTSYQADRMYDGDGQGLHNWGQQPHDELDDITIYGIDRGFKDLDIGRNDDMNAITGVSPRSIRDHLNHRLDGDNDLIPMEFGFGMNENPAFKAGAYYDKPVRVGIPRVLEPLPSKLLENPMNLLVSVKYLFPVFCH